MSTNYFTDHRDNDGLAGTPETPFQPAADSLTYESFFGLNEKPFSLAADPRFIYDSPAHAVARKSLLAGIRRREGLMVLTGEIGTGKTTLCRTVLRELGPNTYSSLVLDPFATREELLKMLLIDFGVMSVHDLTASRFQRISRTELGYLLTEFLDSLHRDAFAVVIIDEAQHLALPLIEETRILFDTFGAKGRLQIVFVGQPELHGKLKLPEMRQVDQRICGYHRLAPMSREAVACYIQHRLQVAGAHVDRSLFPPAVTDVVHSRTGGVPRLINRVCERALHLAYERQAHTVTQEILDAALLEVGSVTLSPTWDSIVFGEPQSALAAVTAQAPKAPPPAAAPDKTEGDEDFKAQMDQWDAMNAPAISIQTATVQSPSMFEEQARIPSTETWRHFPMRMAMAALALVTLALIVLATRLVVEAQSPLTFPTLPLAPAKILPDVVLLQPPSLDRTSGATDTAPAEYLVSVGSFARARAAELIDTLRQAGLPASQRLIEPYQIEMRQIVLGPFPSRGDAIVALRRMQLLLGGYEDAVVFEGTNKSSL